MKTTYRLTLCAVLAIAVISNSACTSLQSVPATPDAVSETSLEPDDKVTLVYPDGSELEISVTSVTETGISGTDRDGNEIAAAFDDLSTIKLVQYDPKKTRKRTGKTLGIVALGVLFAGAAAAEALGAIAAGP